MPDFNRTELPALPVSIAINALLKEAAREAGEPTRGYLGASSIGSECMRQVQFDWMCDQQHPLQTRETDSRADISSRSCRATISRARNFSSPTRIGSPSPRSTACCAVTPTVSSLLAPRSSMPAARDSGNIKGSPARAGRISSATGYGKPIRPTRCRSRCINTMYQHFLGVDEHPAIFTATNARTGSIARI
jgi:hypothetical protein